MPDLNAPYTPEDLDALAELQDRNALANLGDRDDHLELSIQTCGSLLEIEEGWTTVFSEGNAVCCHLDLDQLDLTDRETVREAFDRIKGAMQEIEEVLEPWHGVVNADG